MQFAYFLGVAIFLITLWVLILLFSAGQCKEDGINAIFFGCNCYQTTGCYVKWLNKHNKSDTYSYFLFKKNYNRWGRWEGL